MLPEPGADPTATTGRCAGVRADIDEMSSAEEALERLVHKERWPDHGFENGEQILAE
jgi:hypothetical protein